MGSEGYGAVQCSGGGGAGSGSAGAGADDWRRDAPKHAPYLEPVSPPDTHHARYAISQPPIHEYTIRIAR